MVFHFPPSNFYSQDAPKRSPWQKSILMQFGLPLETKKWPYLEQYIGNMKENSVESVKFSFYRHILNYHFYTNHPHTIQTTLVEKVCTTLLSRYKDFLGFLSLSASI